MTEIAAVFAANFGFIALKAFQQRNVMAAQYPAIVVTSYLLSATEVFVVWKIANVGPTLSMVLTVGTAAGLGAVCATALHARLFR